MGYKTKSDKDIMFTQPLSVLHSTTHWDGLGVGVGAADANIIFGATATAAAAARRTREESNNFMME